MLPIYSAITLKNISKTFGTVKALNNVSLNIEQFTFHALMGENGAGKSTIAKCLMGFYKAEVGEIIMGGEAISISNPKDAHKRGIGMVYQHFMLIDNMTVAENLIIARDTIPAILNWRDEKIELEKFMQEMPFQLNLKAFVRNLSAGEKQKLEILKMLYLKCNILILDEPTSVLTPAEADEVLSFLRNLVDRKLLTVIIISHKFREIFGYADVVSVLRKGEYAGGGNVSDFSKAQLANLMLGNKAIDRSQVRESYGKAPVRLLLKKISSMGESGLPIINELNLSVKKGEIYGIAGVSGNGQKRLVELLSGQVKVDSGKILIDGREYNPVRKSMKKEKFHCLPEEPLKNACVPEMSVAENMALRYYDHTPYQRKGIVKTKLINSKAENLIREFNVKTPTPGTPIKALSGGNVQRAILARELSLEVEILVISNPCFGLDFNAISEIRSLIMQVRNRGAAVLLLSEDLDEIIEISDRIGVIFNGSIIYETPVKDLNMSILGEKMAGL